MSTIRFHKVLALPLAPRPDSVYWLRVVDGYEQWMTDDSGALFQLKGEGPAGASGASAYQTALSNGFIGNQAAWLDSLVGVDGLTAFELAQAAGFLGTEAEWLLSLKGDPGDPGTNGWTEVPAIVSDGERRVIRIVDYVGGTGTKPATGKYIGAAGLVDLVADGVDVRGAVGIDGSVGAGVFIDTFLVSGTWTKRARATLVEGILFGSGGGGASGGFRGAGIAANGGGGGGGGGYASFSFPADGVPASVSVLIGAGGIGGASISSSGFGASGGAGGDTTFGTLVRAEKGNFGNGNGAAGAGRTPWYLHAAGTTTGAGSAGGATAAGALSGAASLPSGGGGGGGAVNAAGTEFAGGGSGGKNTSNTGLLFEDFSNLNGGSVGVGRNGRNGYNFFDGRAGGTGGSGGAGSTIGAGGNGGEGGFPGGGGGGGGGGQLVPSGNGGNGGNGLAIIITYCEGT